MNAKEFKKHLKTVSKLGTVLAAKMDVTIGPLELDADELQDLLGDASEGDFAFLSFDEEEGVAFKKGVTPIGVVGNSAETGDIEQPEGLLLAQVVKGAVKYFSVDIDGTLVPGTEKSFDKDIAKWGLKPLTG